MNLITHDSPIRVVLADDHQFFRQIFSSFLRQQENIKLVGEANDGNELIQLVQTEKPDIALTDVNMPHMDGVRATSILKQQFPNVGVIALTLFADDPMIVQMLSAGADGYLVKSVMEAEIVEAIKTVHNKGMYYCTAVANRLVHLMAKTKFNPLKSSDSLLSEKEKQIMCLICKEYSSKQIAQKLNIPVRTVESSRDRIQEKIGAKNMVGIVIYAIKTGIFHFELA